MPSNVSSLHLPAPPQVWSDVYGALHARYAARAGNHAWLVAAAPETAGAAAEALALWLAGEGGRLKGHLELLVHGTLLPLERTLRGQPFSGVLVVGGALAGGPALQWPERTVTAASGLSYREGGPLPAWRAATLLSGVTRQGESAAASLCAALSVPVLVCEPPQLGEALLSLAGRVPQGLALIG
ncbi:hypothetical protein [Deinococcus rubellus]|uniref:Uncharacterized protein n=1 Tax=Deinococcus rubellus TaxID=1889240 RepID=A0ABY5YH17_9DEIO|nr:hypothetical protein [Deinococcus rubellus]UWX64367.1 hypothetical protein N0D28_01455 [Deinococcus rubellus]